MYSEGSSRLVRRARARQLACAAAAASASALLGCSRSRRSIAHPRYTVRVCAAAPRSAHLSERHRSHGRAAAATRMARQLWLLRHAEAEPHGTGADAERRLTERGRAAGARGRASRSRDSGRASRRSCSAPRCARARPRSWRPRRGARSSAGAWRSAPAAGRRLRCARRRSTRSPGLGPDGRAAAGRARARPLACWSAS